MILKNFGIHRNRYIFPETQHFAPKILFLMYLGSIKIPAKFEPNRKYAWGQPTRNAHKEKAHYGRLIKFSEFFRSL
jgi:hypothetical protein